MQKKLSEFMALDKACQSFVMDVSAYRLPVDAILSLFPKPHPTFRNWFFSKSSASDKLREDIAIGLMNLLSYYLYMLLQRSDLWKFDPFLSFIGLQNEDMRRLVADHAFAVASDSTDARFELSRDRKYSIADFDFIKVLGKGSMGKVILVKEKEKGGLFALKSIHKSSIMTYGEFSHTRSERNILADLSKLRHPFFIRMHCCFQSESDLFFLLDYCPGGDLATQLALSRKFSEDRAKFYAAEIILGIERLHQSGVIYRDLKPENILLDRNGSHSSRDREFCMIRNRVCF